MSSSSVGGAFDPNSSYNILGNWSFAVAPTITGMGAYVTESGAATLTSKTLTSPIITGTVTGAPTIGAAIYPDTKFCTTQFDAVTGTTGATLTNIVGLTGFTLVASAVYLFEIRISGVSTANCGLKLGFGLTTATLTDLEAVGQGFTASAVAVQHTTTATTGMTLFGQTAAVIAARVFGRLTVNAGGTLAVQAAQNAAHADTTSVYVGSSATLIRVA